MGSTPVGGSKNSFSEYFDLRTLLHYLHFIQVTNPFKIYSCLQLSSSMARFVWKPAHFEFRSYGSG